MARIASLFAAGDALHRDRVPLLAGIVLTTAAAWVYMVREANAFSISGVCECMGMAMGGPDSQQWSTAQWAALFLMWSEMMVAMMLPSATPMILVFASVNRSRREQQKPFVPTLVFVSGYLVVWCAFSAGATWLQWLLHGKAWISPQMTASNRWVAGALLGIAGLFQFTSWKNRCLALCASPLSFLLSSWRDGWRGAFAMGLRHGAFCLGCCWSLMLLLFVFGVMNVLWIAALTIYVFVEKLFGNKRWIGVAAGVVLCAAGAVMIAFR